MLFSEHWFNVIFTRQSSSRKKIFEKSKKSKEFYRIAYKFFCVSVCV